MNKLAVGIGLVVLIVGVYLLATYTAPTRGELENPYGDWSDLRKYGGWACVGISGVILVRALARALRAGRRDPDLPDEYKV